MFLDNATEAMWSQIWKRVVSLLKVGFFAMISLVTFVLFWSCQSSLLRHAEDEVVLAYPFS